MQSNIQPSILVIFGATGDLMRKKLAPALFNMYRGGVLPEKMRVIGFSRRELSNEEFRELMYEALVETNFFSAANSTLRHAPEPPASVSRQTSVRRSTSISQPTFSRRTGLKQPPPAKKLLSPNAFEHWQFTKLLSYIKGDFTRAEGYKRLREALLEQDKEWGVCANKLFYLAVPPKYYEVILDNLDKNGLAEGCSPEQGWTRIIIEKPFGKDLESAKALDRKLSKLFREEQIFRIDHYLGKESLQNILAFRFSNAIFEPVWNKDYIDNVQIIASERLGLEGRVTFYDKVGALRDMVQSHLLQMVAAVAAEQPSSFEAESIRNERVEVLKALVVRSEKWEVRSGKAPIGAGVGSLDVLNNEDNLTSKNQNISLPKSKIHTLHLTPQIIRGQYKGYKKEKGVDKDSETETLAALKLFIDNKRWEGVPFYLITGKKMKKDLTRIVVEFKRLLGDKNFFRSNSPNRSDSDLFSRPTGKYNLTGNIATDTTQSKSGGWPQVKSERAQTSDFEEILSHERSSNAPIAGSYHTLSPNRIIFEMKPEQCISIETNMKEPGLEMKVAPHKLKLDYGKAHGHKLLASYERLLVDCMLGDQTLFARTDEVLASWGFIGQIRQIGRIGRIKKYRAGSWGPREAGELVERDGRRWYL